MSSMFFYYVHSSMPWSIDSGETCKRLNCDTGIQRRKGSVSLQSFVTSFSRYKIHWQVSPSLFAYNILQSFIRVQADSWYHLTVWKGSWESSLPWDHPQPSSKWRVAWHSIGRPVSKPRNVAPCTIILNRLRQVIAATHELFGGLKLQLELTSFYSATPLSSM